MSRGLFKGRILTTRSGARSKHGERSVQVLVVKLEEKSYLEDLGINGRIILKWVLKKWDEDHGLNQCGSG